MSLRTGYQDIAAQKIRTLPAVPFVGVFVELAGRHQDGGLGRRTERTDHDARIRTADTN